MIRELKVGDPVYFDHWRGVVIRLLDLDGDDADGDMIEAVTVQWDDGSGFSCFRARDFEPRRPN